MTRKLSLNQALQRLPAFTGNVACGFKIEIAGMGVAKCSIVASTRRDMNTFADSGATSHFFCSNAVFNQGTLHFVGRRSFTFADNSKISATSRRALQLPLEKENLCLSNVFSFQTSGRI